MRGENACRKRKEDATMGKIGFIGLGIMGKPMAKNLLSGGMIESKKKPVPAGTGFFFCDRQHILPYSDIARASSPWTEARARSSDSLKGKMALGEMSTPRSTISFLKSSEQLEPIS